MKKKKDIKSRETSLRSSAPTKEKDAKTQNKSSESMHKSAKPTNQWRNELGVDEPLRIGRGIRTRDEFFAGQNNKEIHPEIDKEELYRRGVVLDIDDNENLAIVKTHNLKNKRHPAIPNDEQQRRYEREIQTASGSNARPKPIRIEQGKFELAPKKDNVSPKQAERMLSEVEKSSKTNNKRLRIFRLNKKKEGR